MEDIDLMAGIWLERPVEGGVVPSTLYCVVVEQLRRSLVSDRHWYERPNRPNAFIPGSCNIYLLSHFYFVHNLNGLVIAHAFLYNI